jgi:hypothetical protein
MVMVNLVAATRGNRRVASWQSSIGRWRRSKLGVALPLCVALVSWFGSGCQADRTESVEKQAIRLALKATGGLDLSAIFGMETPSAWSTTTLGAVLGQSSTHSQGSYSLSVQPSNSNGYTPIRSVALTTLPVVSPTLAVDIMLPNLQPNPYWYGTAQAYIDCPSRGIYSQFLNQVELTGKPLGVWSTVNFTLTNAWISGLLQPGYLDLTITIVLNVQVPTTGIYFVDNLRFVAVTSNGCGNRPNGTSCTDGDACTLGDTCQSGSCHPGSAVTCTASDQCHDIGTCDSTTGICSKPVKPGTPPCDDGNACTQNDTCQAGICVGTSPVTCTPQDICHVAGTCDPATGQCSNPPRTGGPADVIPTLVCVNPKGNGQFEALFGYTNPDSEIATIQVGQSNQFYPGPKGRGQKEDFLPITSEAAFSVLFNGDPLTWSLPGGCATASSQSTMCPSTVCSPSCKRGEKCVGGKCVTQCGDGLCAGDENCSTCQVDCGCPAGMVCYAEGCATPVQCGGVGWACGSGTSFGVAVDCGTCAGGKTCVDHFCE